MAVKSYGKVLPGSPLGCEKICVPELLRLKSLAFRESASPGREAFSNAWESDQIEHLFI